MLFHTGWGIGPARSSAGFLNARIGLNTLSADLSGPE